MATSRPDDEKIRDLARAAAEAFGAGSAERLVDLFTDEVVRFPPNEPAVKGREANLAWFQEALSQFDGSVEFYPEEIVVIDNWAFGWGNFTMSMTPKGGGEPVAEEGKYLDILRRQPDGSWKYSHHMFNSNEPTDAEGH